MRPYSLIKLNVLHNNDQDMQSTALYHVYDNVLFSYLSLVFYDECINTLPQLEKPQPAPVSRPQRYQLVLYMEVLSCSLLSLLCGKEGER